MHISMKEIWCNLDGLPENSQMWVSSCYLNGPLPYAQSQITIDKNVLSASLNKTFPAFLKNNTGT